MLTAFCAAGVLFPTLCAQGGAPLPAPVNVHGDPVRGIGGAPLTYTAAQMARQGSGTAPLPLAAAPGGTYRANAADAAPYWTWFALGTGIGMGGLHVSAANGATELITTGGASGFGSVQSWFILRHNPATNEYDQRFASPTYGTGRLLRRLEVGDAHATPGPEIVVLREDGVLEVWNQALRLRIANYSTGLSDVRGLRLADVDRNGSLDYVVCNQTSVVALGPTGTTLWTVPGAGGQDLAVAQMDADAGLEVATADGKVIDADTRTVQWTWRNPFGFDLEAADIDGDGRAELVAAEAWSWIWAYDVDTQLPKWSLANFNTGAIRLGDVDADGTIELLVGDAQWGEAKAYDTKTQAKEWGIRNPEHGTTEIAFGDPDGDGKVEVIWGAGYTSTGADRLYIGDIAARAIEWNSIDLSGPFLGPVTGDVTGDGKPELVTMSTASDSGYAGPRILVFDGATLSLLGISTAVTSSGFSSAAAQVRLFQLDADPALEIVVCAGGIMAFDFGGGTFTRFWELGTAYPVNRNHYSVEILDVDGDAKLDVVAGAAQFLVLYDFATKAELWKSFFLGNEVPEIEVAQGDGDANLECFARSSTGDVYVFDLKNRAAEAILAYPSVPFTAIDALDLGGGPAVFFAGDNQGGLSIFYWLGASYVRLGTLPFTTGALDGLFVFDATPWILHASGGKLRINLGGTQVWNSVDFGAKFGREFALLPAIDTIVGGGTQGVAAFRLR